MDYSPSSGSTPTGLPSRERRDLFHLVLGRLQQPRAMRLQRLAALVDADRLVERHLAALQIFDDLLQRLQRLLEAQRLDVVIGVGFGRSSLIPSSDGRHARRPNRTAPADRNRLPAG